MQDVLEPFGGNLLKIQPKFDCISGKIELSLLSEVYVKNYQISYVCADKHMHTSGENLLNWSSNGSGDLSWASVPDVFHCKMYWIIIWRMSLDLKRPTLKNHNSYEKYILFVNQIQIRHFKNGSIYSNW